MPHGNFTIRIYGLLISNENNILVTDEIFQGKRMTKFPGGGLEQGEGSIDCLKREIKEELGQDVEVGKHFYTTDFFQPSIFFKEYQVLCIYYFIEAEKYSFEVKEKPFDFPSDVDGTIVFRWVPLIKIKDEPFTFENDRKVAAMLFERFIK
jgi:8-oxo-dGTP diphosphatase